MNRHAVGTETVRRGGNECNERDGGRKCVREMDLEHRVRISPPPPVIFQTITGRTVCSRCLHLLLSRPSFCRLNLPSM